MSYLTDTAEPVGSALPTYQIGSCAADAQQQIESRAKNCGFEAVFWDYAHVVPDLLPGAVPDAVPAIAATG